MKAIQIIAEFKTEQESQICLDTMKEQGGFLGGRLLEPSYFHNWQMQAIMESNGEYPSGWLPDGMRHVWVPVSLMTELGIK